MKKIKSLNFKKLEADLITHPPIHDEEEDVKKKKKKKKKKIYQLNRVVDDVEDE